MADKIKVELSPLRLRRARSLAMYWRGNELIVYNFLLSRAFSGTVEMLALLSDAEEWCEPHVFFNRFDRISASSVARQLAKLVQVGGLVVEGTPEASLDEEYERSWEWGVAAGLYHFGIKNERYANDHDARLMLRKRLKIRAQPSLLTDNAHLSDIVKLHRPRPAGLIRTMVRRRSERWFGRQPISADQLSRCLYAGLGITGFIEDAELGQLPLKMAPSGGARNPYDGYVYVRNVHGVPPGVYHYSAIENSLGLLSPPPMPPVGKLLSNQDWADGAAAVLFLVATFERTAWKYPHPNSYRVVLMEAGHIVQNVLLVASEQGLAAAPTAALQEAPIEALLKLNPVCQGVVYAVTLGMPAKRRSFSIRGPGRSSPRNVTRAAS